MRRPLIAVAVLALAFPLLVACGSSGGGDNASSGDATTSASPSTSSTEGKTANCPATGGVPAFKGTWGVGPTIPAGEGTPPTTLKTADCLVGTGPAVTDTSTSYDWNYTGALYKNGDVFDSSFARGAPIAFSLNQVIPGWTKGLEGMKVGGRRLLVIPPSEGYGSVAQGAIPANSTLVFVVDLVGPTAG